MSKSPGRPTSASIRSYPDTLTRGSRNSGAFPRQSFPHGADACARDIGVVPLREPVSVLLVRMADLFPRVRDQID